MRQAPRLRSHAALIEDTADRSLVERVIDRFTSECLPRLSALPAQVQQLTAEQEDPQAGWKEIPRTVFTLQFVWMETPIEKRLEAEPEIPITSKGPQGTTTPETSSGNETIYESQPDAGGGGFNRGFGPGVAH